MSLKTLINLRLSLVVVAGLLALFGVANAFVAIFVPARFEVIYHYDVTAWFCAGGNCAYSADLEVANSGKEWQAEVVLQLSGLPSGIGASPRVLNLDAAYPRGGDPDIAQTHAEGMLRIEIRQLAPGTLLEFRLGGFIPQQGLETAPRPALQVQARGRLIEGNPRGIAIARMLS